MIRRSKIFENIRGFAESTGDLGLAVRLLAIIACITKDKADITSALGKAREHSGHQSVTAEALAIIVRVLAKARRYDEARNIVGNKKRGIAGEMVGKNAYWHTEAAIALARFSGEADDEEEAKTLVSHIRDHGLRDEARGDLEIAGRRHNVEVLPANPIFQLAILAGELTDGRAKHDSAYVHVLVDQIIDGLFISTLK